MRICLILVSLSALLLAANGKIEWNKNQMEDLVAKDRSAIKKIYGAVTELKRLKEAGKINQTLYTSEISKRAEEVSAFINLPIKTEGEVNEVCDFFLGIGSTFSKASNLRGIYLFTDVLTIVAVLAVLASAGNVLYTYVVPLLVKLDNSSKIALAFVGASSIILFAGTVCPLTIQNYVATIGAVALGAAYMYALSFCKPSMSPPWHIIGLPVIIVWSILAIYFHTKIIGFLTVAVFEAVVGFVFYTGSLYIAMGFHGRKEALSATFSSGALCVFYITYTLNIIPVPDSVRYAIEVFEIGILFLGTLVYFLGLLILSSRFLGEPEFLLFNTLALCSGLLAFFLGSISPTLILFRGVASTFFVIYLMQKWIEIRWERDCVVPLLGGGMLILGICYFIKTFTWMFAFS